MGQTTRHVLVAKIVFKYSNRNQIQKLHIARRTASVLIVVPAAAAISIRSVLRARLVVIIAHVLLFIYFFHDVSSARVIPLHRPLTGRGGTFLYLLHAFRGTENARENVRFSINVYNASQSSPRGSKVSET